ncbi:MAG: efflux RND transporter periplasmic adaptor subunit [Acidobacteria bacterium]|nr:efflux RND transporter periplasmic adaptor subunit [Acidobacteriota bacterium]
MSKPGPFRVRARVVRTLRLLASGAAVVLAASFSSGSDSGGSAASPGGGGQGGRGGAPAAVVVTTATVLERPMAIEARAVGNVEASSSVAVRAQVSGELLKVGFTEGQDVVAGQTLFTLNPRQFEVAVQQAEAALTRSEAQARGMEAQVDRSTELLKRDLVSRAEHMQLSTQLAVYRAQIEADRAALENAKLQLQYTTIAAPVSGRTGALLVHPGSLVRANDAAPLVMVNQVTPAYVSFAVPARLLPELRRDQSRGSLRVLAAPAGSTAEAVTGSLTFVDNAVDQATDTIRLKATFPNRDRALWAGAFVDVTLQLSVEPKAIVVPNAAVQASQQGQYVYVIKPDSTAELRPVTVAWQAGNDVVIRTGLTPGETVVTDGQLRLTPGARVTTQSAGEQARTTP